MSIKVSQAFERTSSNPIDATLALTKAQMLATNDNLMPSKYLTVCQDDGQIYLYDKSATANSTTGKFTVFSGGSGSGADNVVEGYYNASNSKFYKESTFTTAITGSAKTIYIDLSSNKCYRASGSSFVRLDNEVFVSTQVATLPTASSPEVGKIYQYIGTTNGIYTSGYFYECVYESGSYSWKQKDVQPASSGGGSGSGSGGGAGISIDATLLASGWNSSTKQQTLTFASYESTMGGVIGMPISATDAQKAAYADAAIDVVSQSGTSFTFHCEKVPSVDLPVTLYAGGGSGGSGSGVPAGGTTGQTLVKKSNTDGDVEWKDVGNSVFEIHFANNAVDVIYSQLGEALSANRILKLIDTENNVVLAFTGYNSGAYYFSTICLNRRQEMVNTSIVLYQSAPSSDVVATQVQRLTLTEDVQKIEMPTADSSYLNKIYQYIGTTDANYTNGLFYKCVTNGGQYTWEQCDVQSYPEADLTNVFSSGMPVASVSGDRRFNYQTDEHEVGTWIDGSTLYQKTYSLSMVTDGSNIAPINISGTYQLRFIHSCLSYDNNSLQESTFYWQSDNYWVVWIENGYIKGKANQTSYGGKSIYVTLQYTKNS